MAKTFKLKWDTWTTLKEQLLKDNGPMFLALRDKVRRERGFSVREFEDWDHFEGRYVHEMHLDFFDDAGECMFALQYGEFLSK